MRVYQFRHIRADAQSSQALDSFTTAAEAGSARRSKQPAVPEIPNRVVAEGRLDSANATSAQTHSLARLSIRSQLPRRRAPPAAANNQVSQRSRIESWPKADSIRPAAEAGFARRSKQPAVPEIPNRVVAEGRLDSAATRFGK